MKRVGILGGGQLGMMLGEAVKQLDAECCFLDPNSASPAKRVGELTVASFDDENALKAFAKGCDVITYEFENVPVSSVRFLEKFCTVHPSSEALETTQDRLTEKELLVSLGIPTPIFANVTKEKDLVNFSTPYVLKTRRMGYDGKGQWLVRTASDAAYAWKEAKGVALILEEFIAFEREASIIAVRAPDGDMRTYPLIENHHEGGILRRSLAPAPDIAPEMQERATTYARDIMEKFSYVGTMTIEFFVKGNELIANEIAPRVHNSGHLTIEGAQTSQFENHLRAILGLPLGSTELKGYSAMLNVIGDNALLKRTISSENIFMHDYGKTPREGRKLGHVTIVGRTAEERDMIVRSVVAN